MNPFSGGLTHGPVVSLAGKLAGIQTYPRINLETSEERFNACFLELD